MGRTWKQPIFTENVVRPFSEPCAYYFDSPRPGRYYCVQIAPAPNGPGYYALLEAWQGEERQSTEELVRVFSRTDGDSGLELIARFHTPAARPALIALRKRVMALCAKDETAKATSEAW